MSQTVERTPMDPGLPLRPDGMAYRLKSTQTHWVEVIPMIFNHRVVMTPKGDENSYDRGWCYPSLIAAVAAVHVWDPETEDEPVGWIKRVGG